jgi:hypothetical protein
LIYTSNSNEKALAPSGDVGQLNVASHAPLKRATSPA